MMTDSEHDRELLRRWAIQTDELAFRQLVERYAGLVHGVAFRRTGGHQPLAQEIGQSVFTMLARKAPGLIRHPSLACWLHRAAVLESAHQLRRESAHARRLTRLAALSPGMISPSDPTPEPAPPELDEALAKLGESDRALLLRRFFEDLSYAEIAALSGKNETAVRKQLERALSRLAPHLRPKGAAAAAAAAAISPLSAGEILRAAMTHTAPAGFAGSAGHAALLAAPSLTSLQLLVHTIQLMAYGKLLIPAGAVLALMLSFGGGYSGALHFNGGPSGTAATGGPADSQDISARKAGPGVKPARRGVLGNPGDSPAKARLRAQLSFISKCVHMDMQSRSLGFGGTGAGELGAGLRALGEFSLEDLEESWKLLPEFRSRRQEFENLAAFLAGLRATRIPAETVVRELTGENFRIDGRPPPAALLLAAGSWFSQDPEAAWGWMRQAIGNGDFPSDRRQLFGAEFVGDWMGRDPEAALAALAPLGPEWTRFTQKALNEALKSDDSRAALWPVLEKADDRTALMVADSHPEASEWARETLLPWLLTRTWRDGTDADRILNAWTWRDGQLDSDRFGMLCRSVGALPTEAANTAVLKTVKGIFADVTPEALPKLLEHLVPDAGQREKLAAKL